MSCSGCTSCPSSLAEFRQKPNPETLAFFQSIEFDHCRVSVRHIPPTAGRQWSIKEKSHSWKRWNQLVEFVKKIDFTCKFESDGSCKTTRNMSQFRVGWVSKARNCCADCHSRYGYLDRIPSGTAKIIASLFSKKYGFWRKDKGCILPHKWRSPVCLGHSCAEQEHYKLFSNLSQFLRFRLWDKGTKYKTLPMLEKAFREQGLLKD